MSNAYDNPLDEMRQQRDAMKRRAAAAEDDMRAAVKETETAQARLWFLEAAVSGIPDDVLAGGGLRTLIDGATEVFGNGSEGSALAHKPGPGTAKIVAVYPVLRRLHNFCRDCGTDSHGGVYDVGGRCAECAEKVTP